MLYLPLNKYIITYAKFIANLSSSFAIDANIVKTMRNKQRTDFCDTRSYKISRHVIK